MTDSYVNYGGLVEAYALHMHAEKEQAESMGQRIKRLTQAKNHSQASLARKLGVSRSTVNQWFLDLSKPTPEHLLALCDELGTDPHYLVFGPDRAPGPVKTPVGRHPPASRRRRT